MDIRESFSRLKKKLKHPGSKHKPDRTMANSRGEREDFPASASLPVPHVVVGGGHSRGEDGANAGERWTSSTDRPPLPDVPAPVLAGGCEGNEGGEDGSVDGVEVSQRHPRPHSDVKVVVGTGPGLKGNGSYGENVGQVHHPPSNPSIQLSGSST